MRKVLFVFLLGIFALSGFNFVNAKISTSDWIWYKDKNDGFKIKMPKNWYVKKYYFPELYFGMDPLRYTTFNNPNDKYYLHLGIKKAGQNIITAFRTGVGVGDVKAVRKAKLGKKRVWARFWAYKNKTKEVLFNTDKKNISFIGYCDFGNRELSAMFEASDKVKYDSLNIKKSLYEYKVAKKMLRTFKVL